MKKTLKKDITRYDKKMQLRVDGAAQMVNENDLYNSSHG